MTGAATGPARRLRFAALLACALAAAAGAREFRSIVLIPTPRDVPLEGREVVQVQPVERALVEQAVYALADAWNTGDLGALLADDFSEGSRLLDLLAEVVPRDARLAVLGIEGVSTLEQRVVDAPDGDTRVSTVSAIVRTQVEFTDPIAGFLRLEGRNEFYFRVEQALEDAAGALGE